MTTSTSVAALLKYNMKRKDIAAELGLTPSAVTQSAQRLPPQDTELTPIHQRLDEAYDEVEGKLLEQLKRTMPLLMRPMEISRVLQTVNAAKRRGGPLKATQAAPTVLQLNLPIAIQNRFVLNSLNQVVSAGAQDLVTIPSAAVSRLAAASTPQLGHTHALNQTSAPATQAIGEDEFGFRYSEPAGS
jgi:predicted transcriptional regulator